MKHEKYLNTCGVFVFIACLTEGCIHKAATSLKIPPAAFHHQALNS